MNKASSLLDLWLFAVRRYVERMGDFMKWAAMADQMAFMRCR
jgi:hypothetical protein